MKSSLAGLYYQQADLWEALTRGLIRLTQRKDESWNANTDKLQLYADDSHRHLLFADLLA